MKKQWMAALMGSMLAAALLAGGMQAAQAEGKKPAKAAAAEKGPSRQETIDFIQRRGAEFGTFSGTYTPASGSPAFRYPTTEYRDTSFAISDSSLTIDVTYRGRVDRQGSNYEKTELTLETRKQAKVALAELSSQINWGRLPEGRPGCGVNLECAGGADCFEMKRGPTNDKETRWTDDGKGKAMFLFFSNPDQCERMAKAFTRLIELSGGKKEKDAF